MNTCESARTHSVRQVRRRCTFPLKNRGKAIIFSERLPGSAARENIKKQLIFARSPTFVPRKKKKSKRRPAREHEHYLTTQVSMQVYCVR